PAREGGGYRVGLRADPSRWLGLFQWRYPAPPDHAARRRRKAHLPDLRVCDRPEYAPLATLHLTHEGCGRVLRISAGVQRPGADHAGPTLACQFRTDMKRPTRWLLSAGVLLLAGEIVSHSLPAGYATLAMAGWGLLLVTLFHLVPLAVDAAAIRVLLPARSSWRDTVLARWAGESASSLLPFGQLAGPVVMIRQLARRGVLMQNAVAAITVSTTLQVLAQTAFALMGVTLITGQVSPHPQNALRPALLLAAVVLAAPAMAFYLLQRRGVFTWSMRAVSRLSRKHDWSSLQARAQAIDHAVQTTYEHGT